MVWSNSGGFKQGSGNTDMCGPDFLVEKDVIVVTFNYRSGPLGFLCLNTPDVPGNAGLKDQALALKWVKENIENFGGNSGNVTIFGESSGGASCSYLTLSPLSKDLISKAIFQSGTSLNRWASVQNDPVENAKKLAQKLGSDSNELEEIYAYLQTVPVKELIDASEKLQAAYISTGTLKFAPVIEKEFPGTEAFLTEPAIDVLSSGRAAKIPLMIGSTAQEATEYLYIIDNFTIDEDLRSFIPKSFNIEHNSERAVELASELKTFYFNDAHIGMDSLNQYLNLLSDRDFLSDIHRYVNILTQTSTKPLYYYRFSYNGGLNILRKVLDSFGLTQAGHMDELGYLFNISNQRDLEVSSDDQKTRERMVQMWTNFAKTGNPTPEESQHLNITWLPVNAEHGYYLNIDKELTLSTDLDKERMKFWDNWYSKYFKVWNVGTSEKALSDQVVSSESFESPAVQMNNFESPVVQLDNLENDESPAEQNDSLNDSGIIDEIVSMPVQVLVEPVEEVQKTLEVTETNGIEKTNDNALEEKEIVIEENESIIETNDNGVEKNDNAIETKEKENTTNGNAFETNINVAEKIGNGVKTNENEIETDGAAVVIANGSISNGKEEQEVIQKIDNILIDEENKEKLKSNGDAKDIIRANDPPEDDLPKNIGVNRFVSFFEALGGKKKK